MAKIRTPQEQADIEQTAKWFACGMFVLIVIVSAIVSYWIVNTFLGF